MSSQTPSRSALLTNLFAALSLAQGLVYITTGLWPIVHMPSFLRVTGPKRDLWLVNTVGAVITAVGAALTLAGLRRRHSAEITVLGAGSALALTGIDLVYVARREIGPVYLLDAAGETALLGAWAALSALQARTE